MTTSTYMIGDLINHDFPHHESYEKLWTTKWKKPCTNGTYPFVYGALEDFEEVSKILISKDMKEPYDWDAYAEAFVPRAEKVVSAASAAELAGDTDKAAELYLRASALYRISRYPIPRSDKQWNAWERGKDTFLKGQKLIEYGVQLVDIPYSHGIQGEGPVIPSYVYLPKSASATHPAPMVLIASGLDGYRTENCHYTEALGKMGIGQLVFEIPGTGDCPALASDPASVDRMMDSILQWCKEIAEVDESKTCIWGLSTGGAFAMRSAHTMKNKLFGAVVQGGGFHRKFDREWLDRVDKMEYPFDLAESLAIKFGYGTDINRFKSEAQAKFSLLSNGILDRPCTRTLLVNGMDDTIFPIEDNFIALQHGSAKEARFYPGVGHMGAPDGVYVILDWIFDLFSCPRREGDMDEAMRSTTLSIKYSVP